MFNFHKSTMKNTKVFVPPCFLTDWKIWWTEKLKFKFFGADILLRSFHTARLNFSVKCFQITFLIVSWLFGRQNCIIGGGFDLFFDWKLIQKAVTLLSNSTTEKILFRISAKPKKSANCGLSSADQVKQNKVEYYNVLHSLKLRKNSVTKKLLLVFSDEQ